MSDSSILLPRRRFMTGAALGGSGLLLSGCDALTEDPGFRSILRTGEALNKGAHRLIMDRGALAREFSESDISPIFKANGSISGGTPEYAAHVADKFARWSLRIDGMVKNPQNFDLKTLMGMPSREQITRHDCVEGWSAIGKWHGPMLSKILTQADVKGSARHIVFHCADLFHGKNYYTSVDMFDAFHPQTILAWAMNNAPLTVAHGAPIRLRAERQLGYKQAKYVMRIEAVASLDGIGLGQGGYWEDNVDYDTYAGI